MPIYEYECDNCNKQCEIVQKHDDKPLSICPDCGGHMHKLISQTSFILKGTGWYATDYASAERKKAKESDRKTETKAEVKTETAAKS
jgi:putative FmdB family regulatory protein